MLLIYGDHERELYGADASTTNNRMELTAAIEGLRALTRPSRVSLSTDSQYVQKGVTEWLAGWKRRGWRTAGNKPVKNADLWRLLDEVAANHTVEWHWVKGHAGHPQNERADQLVNRAIDELLEIGSTNAANSTRY